MPKKPARPEPPTLSFRAEVGRTGTFASVAVPARVTRAFAPWGVARRISVTGTLDGHPFQTTFLPTADGGHLFWINAATRRETGVAVGDQVAFALTPCGADVVLVPADVAKALRAERGARAAFDALTVPHRKQLLRFVGQAPAAPSRARAIARLVDHALGRPEAPSRPSPTRARPPCPVCGRRDAADGTPHECATPDLSAPFASTPPALMALFARLTALVEECGPAVAVAFPVGAGFVAERRFLTVVPRRAWLELGLYRTQRIEHPRVRRVDTVAPDFHVHRVRLASPDELDDWLAEWVGEAYAFGCHGEPDRGFGERPEV